MNNAAVHSYAPVSLVPDSDILQRLLCAEQASALNGYSTAEHAAMRMHQQVCSDRQQCPLMLLIVCTASDLSNMVLQRTMCSSEQGDS